MRLQDKQKYDKKTFFEFLNHQRPQQSMKNSAKDLEDSLESLQQSLRRHHDGTKKEL